MTSRVTITNQTQRRAWTESEISLVWMIFLPRHISKALDLIQFDRQGGGYKAWSTKNYRQVLYLESRGVFWCTLHAEFAVLTIWHGNIYHSEITSQKETSNQVHCFFFSFFKACKYKINQTDMSFRVGELFFPCPRKNQEHNYKKKKEHGERCFTSPVLGCKTIRHKSASKETKVTRSCKMPLLRDVESLSLPLSTSLYIGASPFESTETVPEYQRDHCSPWHGTWQV